MGADVQTVDAKIEHRGVMQRAGTEYRPHSVSATKIVI